MKYRLIDKTTGIETLCDKVTIEGFDYYVSDEKIHFGYVWNTILEQIETMFKEKTFHDDLKGVIATNNPNTAIPKVVDEVEILADAHCKEWDFERVLGNGSNTLAFDSFVYGYNKSQATHPFSEENMIDFAEFYFREEFNSTMQDCKSSKEILRLWKEQQLKTVYYE
jgi:hypothetical protein